MNAPTQRLTARADAEALPGVAYTTLDTPVGRLVAAATSTGLVRLAYEDHAGGLDAVLDSIAVKLSPRVLEAPQRLDGARRELDEYFEGRRTRFETLIDWSLVGPFARRILAATAAIPFGATRSYAQVAAQAGSPKAHRAAGNALGANPLAIVVPCHRVLRTGGGLGGYTGGLERKETLLRLEGSPRS